LQKIGIFIRWFIRLLDRSFLGLFDGNSKKEKRVHDVRKDTVVAVNTDQTTYMFMSCNENAGRSHNIKLYNSSCTMVAHFKYC